MTRAPSTTHTAPSLFIKLRKIVLIAASCLTACAPGLPDPSITSVTPPWAYNGDYKQVTIQGENFYPQVELDVREDGGRFDRQFGVSLELDGERYSLESVELVDYRHLTAYVPMGLPPARYTVEVTSPMEQLARLPRGFTVTDTRADHLVVSTDEAVVLVEEPFLVRMALEDPDDLPLAQAREVLLSITSERGIGAADLEIDTSGFDEARKEEIDGGYLISLTLRAGDPERNTITLLGHTPDTVDLELSAPEEDSSILPSQDEVSILAGSLNMVQVELPYDDYTTTAGHSFEVSLRLVDEFDNLISTATATLVLYEQCGSAYQAVELQGETQVEFTATGATGDDCLENRIFASGTTSGTSAGFQVSPNDTVEYDVSVYPSSLVAWDDTALVTVRALDAYGNLVVDYGDDWFAQHGKELQIELVDDLEGLDPGQGHGFQSCPGFDDGYQICQARLTTAGANDWITATGEDGNQGKSEDFEVRPAGLMKFDLDHGAPPFVAGVGFDLQVRPTDDYDNTVLIDPASYPYEFEGSPHPISCDSPVNTVTPGLWSFTCVATVADPDQYITVSIPSYAAGVSGSLTEGVEIQNGALGLAVFSQPTGSSIEAGQAFTVEVEVFDTYGNPYLVQSVGAVDLADCTGTLDPVTLAFDATGWGQTSATIIQTALGCSLAALDGGGILGSSVAFDVSNGPLVSLDVTPATPWVFLDEPVDVEIRALDYYSNTVVGFAESVTLGSALGSAASQVVDDFVDGVATVQPDFVTPQLADTLWVESEGGLTASSSAIDVLDSGCGVVADLLVDGDTEPVMCLTTGSVSSTLDASRSTGSVVGYHFDDGAGGLLRTSSATTTTSWTSQAAYLVRAVAFDASACGSIDQVVAYVAEPDGEPAGPVDVTPADLVRVVGSLTDGSSVIDIEAFDCARDVAANGTLYVRTTLGEFTAGPSASGQGLAIVLDSAGLGQLTWSVEAELHGGVSTILVGREGSLAQGSAEIIAAGDDAPPVVLELDPVGASAEITDTFTVRFDDSMLSASTNDTNITFSDSLGPLTIDAIGLSSDGSQAEITLSAAVDLAADIYTLELSDQIRDSAGNRLDGSWDGLSSSFVVQLGAVSNTAPDITTCTPDTTVLRPDGDDQPATDEADMVEVTLSADASATYWLLEVYDAEGLEQGRFWHSAGSAGPSAVLWDARDQAGSILPNGPYTLVFSAADAALDLGAPCQIDVLIDNAIVEVP